MSWAKEVKQENYDIICEEIKEAAMLALEKIKRKRQEDKKDQQETKGKGRRKQIENPKSWWDEELLLIIDDVNKGD